MKEYNGYNIIQLGTFPMVEIKSVGQGPVPAQLRGLYTTYNAAMEMIDSYLRTEKGPRNGKTKAPGKG